MSAESDIWDSWSAEELQQEINNRITHFYGQTDGTMQFPNSMEGDILKDRPHPIKQNPAKPQMKLESQLDYFEKHRFAVVLRRSISSSALFNLFEDNLGRYRYANVLVLPKNNQEPYEVWGTIKDGGRNIKILDRVVSVKDVFVIGVAECL